MRKLLCRLLGLHHYIFIEATPRGYCKHCGVESARVVSGKEWEEIRHEIETHIRYVREE